MKLLVIGSGGREHTLAWKLAQSPLTEKIFVAPGNAGTHREHKVQNINISPLQFEKLAAFVKKENIAYTVVGPEAPLVSGLVDFFKEQNLSILGPSHFAAQLEGSKLFAKQFMQEYSIPTAQAASFSDLQAANDFLAHCQFPIVIKADGLAEGKGVIICQDKPHAEATIEDMLSHKRFGDACQTILIEEFLEGVEVSFIVLSDGDNFVSLATSQDHKARDNNDLGPNTGGMGAYSPAPMMTDDLYNQVIEQAVKPTLLGMKEKGTPYVGFLYLGLMISPDNQVRILEYNCRLGDPETQPLLLRLETDFAQLCQDAINGQLADVTLSFDPRVALGVVLASEGYPNHYEKGTPMPNLKELSSDKDYKVFHAGTKLDDGNIVTNGGRVLCATALGETYAKAQDNAYALVKKISWPGAFYRTDIGFKALDYVRHDNNR
tara:strand:+ start:23633 stop:24934 length:1302 start_codon:yes stop_codon:yes gene_type:complete